MQSQARIFFILPLLLAACVSRTPLLEESPVQQNQLVEGFLVTAEKLAQDAQFDISSYYLKRALAFFTDAGQWDRVIECLVRIGENHQQLEEFEQAMDFFEKALEYAKSYPVYRNEELARHLQRNAYRHMVNREYNQAIRLYREALELITQLFGENHPAAAKIFNALALVYWNKGDTRNAVQYYNRSLSIKLRGFSHSEINFARKFAFIDGGFESRSELRQLKGYFQKSLRIHLETMGQVHPLVASLYENLGILYGFEGSFDPALENFRKSLGIRLELFGEESIEVAYSYHNLGVCLRIKGEYRDALYYLQRSLQIKQVIFGDYHALTADTYYQLGKVHYLLNRFASALDHFQRSLVALVPRFTDETPLANPALDLLLPREEILNVLFEKAETLRMRYLHQPERIADLRLSVETYRLVTELIGLLRRDFKSEDYKLLFGKRSYEIYDRALQAALSLYDISGSERYKHDAFMLSEKSKAAILRESLFDVKAKTFSGIPGALLDREEKLKKDLAYYRTYLEKEYTDPSPARPGRIAELETEYYTRKEHYHRLIAFFEENYPRYFKLKYETKPIRIVDLQSDLPDDAVMLHYFVGRGVLAIFAITRDTSTVVMKFTGPDFEQMVRSYYHSIKKIEDRSFAYLSHKLYRLLIDPVAAVLAGKKHLIIIPQGVLYYVPFEALIEREFKASDFSKADFLIRRFSISYHYSASLWMHRLGIQQAAAKKRFVGFAPVFASRDGANARSAADPTSVIDDLGESVIVEGRRYSVLKASGEEVGSIIDLFAEQGYEAEGYFHERASESNFKSAVSRPVTYVHIATHSLQDRENPILSGLLFSPVPDSPEDGILYSQETFNLELQADLIVLSSCETGVGRLVRGEGMIALNRGFFFSGARNIIFSLWKVQDRATSLLMVELYRRIIDGLPFHRALRRAKLAVMAEPLTAFPNYWSGFILVGE